MLRDLVWLSLLDTLLGKVGDQRVRLAVVRKRQLILSASDGDEEEGALVAQLA